MITVNQALFWAIKKLKKSVCHGDSAPLDAELMLSFARKIRKEELYIHPEKKISPNELKKFKNLIARRARHEPTAYILGEKEFFGLKFFVDKNVLIPRPETELLVEEAIRKFQIPDSKFQILDIGTGSGTIAITLAKNLPEAKIIATDISAAVLKIARKNARRHGVSKKIKFIKTDLLPQRRAFSVQRSVLVVTNLSYLPASVYKQTAPEIKKYEPKNALLGGPDGLNLIRQLLIKTRNYNLHGTVLVEIDPSQPKKLSSFIKKLFPQAVIEIKKDLAGLSRIIKIEIK